MDAFPSSLTMIKDDFVLAESGAILALPRRAERQALADRSPAASQGHAVAHVPDERDRARCSGQAMFFQRIAAPKGIVDEYAIERYVTESKRLLGVLNDALRDQEYLCGEYSMVDIATFPWARAYRWANVDVSDLTHLTAWLARVEAREAVQRGLCVPAGKPRFDYSDDELKAAAQRNAELYDA